MGSLVPKGCRVSVWDDEKFLDRNGGDSCPAGWMYLIPLNSRLKNGQDGCFYIVYTLPQFFLKSNERKISFSENEI